MNDRIEQLHSDYLLTASAFNEALTAAADVCRAAEERMQSERKEVAEKLKQLTARQSDASRSETVRRLAGIELNKLQGWEPSVTVEERAEFEAAIRDAETAKEDMRKLHAETRTELEAVKKRLAEIRADILGDQDVDLRPRWIDREIKRFSRLCDGGVDRA